MAKKEEKKKQQKKEKMGGGREMREERREKREERREKREEKRESELAHVNARKHGFAFCFVFPSSRSARAFRRHSDLAPRMGC